MASLGETSRPALQAPSTPAAPFFPAPGRASPAGGLDKQAAGPACGGHHGTVQGSGSSRSSAVEGAREAGRVVGRLMLSAHCPILNGFRRRRPEGILGEPRLATPSGAGGRVRRVSLVSLPLCPSGLRRGRFRGIAF